MMKFRSLVLAVVVMFMAAGVLFAEGSGAAPTPKADKPGKAGKHKGETVEKTGVVKVEPKTDPKAKFDIVTLTVGADVFVLLGKPCKQIQKLDGKTIKVVGNLKPANDKHPRAAIKVDSFEEIGAAAPAPAPAPATPAPADAGSGSASASGSN